MSLEDEVEGLRHEVELLSKARVSARHLAIDEKLAIRKTPPLAEMTRIQKRYFLEPWMTVASVASGGIVMLLAGLACFTERHVEFAMFAVVWLVITAVAVGTKLNLMDWNSRTEGEVRSKSRNLYDDY